MPVLQVECTCKDKCVGTKDVTGDTHCERIYYHVPVKRRVRCEAGSSVWQDGYQSLAVACVCAMKRTAVQS